MVCARSVPHAMAAASVCRQTSVVCETETLSVPPREAGDKGRPASALRGERREESDSDVDPGQQDAIPPHMQIQPDRDNPGRTVKDAPSHI